jgi:hypothetical protein
LVVTSGGHGRRRAPLSSPIPSHGSSATPCRCCRHCSHRVRHGGEGEDSCFVVLLEVGQVQGGGGPAPLLGHMMQGIQGRMAGSGGADSHRGVLPSRSSACEEGKARWGHTA